MLCLSLWSWCGPLWPLGWGPWPGASLPRHSEQLCGGCIVSLSTSCTGCYTDLPARELSSHCPVSAVVGGLGTWKDRALQDQENHELRFQSVKQLLGVGWGPWGRVHRKADWCCYLQTGSIWAFTLALLAPSHPMFPEICASG